MVIIVCGKNCHNKPTFWIKTPGFFLLNAYFLYFEVEASWVGFGGENLIVFQNKTSFGIIYKQNVKNVGRISFFPKPNCPTDRYRSKAQGLETTGLQEYYWMTKSDL